MTRLVDDIDGSHAVTTLSFSLDGHSYEIDLSESHLSALQQALAPFITAARAVPNGRSAAPAAAPKRTPALNGRPAPAPAAIAPATATARSAAADSPAVESAPFRQPGPGRASVAEPARSKPAPLVADPFNPRS